MLVQFFQMRNVVGTNGSISSIIIIPCFIRWTRGRSIRERNAIHVRPTVKWIGNGGPLLLLLLYTFFLKWATHCRTFTLVFRISGLKPISILDLQQHQPMSSLISLILRSFIQTIGSIKDISKEEANQPHSGLDTFRNGDRKLGKRCMPPYLPRRRRGLWKVFRENEEEEGYDGHKRNNSITWRSKNGEKWMCRFAAPFLFVYRTLYFSARMVVRRLMRWRNFFFKSLIYRENAITSSSSVTTRFADSFNDHTMSNIFRIVWYEVHAAALSNTKCTVNQHR